MRYSIIVLCAICLCGCATAFKGYKSNVYIWNAPSDLRVSTLDGVELPVAYRSERVGMRNAVTGEMKYYDSLVTNVAVIELYSKEDDILLLRYAGIEKRIKMHPKLCIWWFLLDTICGGFPIIVDATTGNWNYYDDIYIKQ
jgi:hypothetical protein